MEVTTNNIDWLEKVTLMLVSVAHVLIPWIFMATPAFDFADLPEDPPIVVPIIGVVLGVLGLFLFYRSHVDLGLNWSTSLELRKEHSLVTRGVYRLVRHPMYSAFFLLAFSQFFLLSNWFTRFTGVAGYFILYACRVSREEKMMEKEFGEEYVRYMAKTPRVMPHLF